MPQYPAPSPPYVGPGRDSGSGNKPIHRIVIHGTVSPCERGGARKIAAYFRSGNARGSAHYVVDPGEVVQVVYDSKVAWHAPPNSNSIGVELCDLVGGSTGALPMSRWLDDDHQAMLKKAARLVAELCLAYDVPPRMRGPRGLRAGNHGLCEHDDVSDAWNQSSHWDVGNFPRVRFARMVRAEVAAITGRTSRSSRVARVSDSARDQLAAARKTRRQKAKRQTELNHGAQNK